MTAVLSLGLFSLPSVEGGPYADCRFAYLGRLSSVDAPKPAIDMPLTIPRDCLQKRLTAPLGES